MVKAFDKFRNLAISDRNLIEIVLSETWKILEGMVFVI